MYKICYLVLMCIGEQQRRGTTNQKDAVWRTDMRLCGIIIKPEDADIQIAKVFAPSVSTYELGRKNSSSKKYSKRWQ